VPWFGTPPNLIGLRDVLMLAEAFLEVTAFSFFPAVFTLPIEICFSFYVIKKDLKNWERYGLVF